MSRIGLHGAVASGRRALLLGLGLSAAGCGLLVGAEEITVSLNGTGGGGGMATGPGGTGGIGGTGSGMGGSSSGSGGMGGSACFDCLEPVWVQDFTGSGQQFVNDVATDAQGNVIVVGTYEETPTFSGTCDMSAPCPVPSAAGADLFIFKLTASGTALWGKVAGNADPLHVQSATGIAVDSAGNVIVAGKFQGSIDLGGGPLSSASATTNDIFVAKLDGGGNHIWSKRFGDASEQFVRGVAVDSGGNILLTGYYQGSFDFGGPTLTNAGGYDMFVAKLNPDGTHAWSKNFSAAGDQRGYSIAVDGSNNVLLTGRFDGSFNLGGGMLNAAGTTDLFVGKLDAAGAYVWSQDFGDAGGVQEGRRIAASPTGDALVTGLFTGTLDFATGNTPLLTSLGTYDAFVTKLSATNGEAIWSRSLGAAGDQTGEGIAAGTNGDVFVTGSMSNTPTFAGQELASAGSIDMYIIRYSSSGTELCGTRYGDTMSQAGTSIAVSPSGDIIAVGSHQGTVDLGCMITATSAGGDDALIARLRP